MEYVLPGKFQSDEIEKRFSMYRQMSGGNYNVSVAQIIDSEKKRGKFMFSSCLGQLPKNGNIY